MDLTEMGTPKVSKLVTMEAKNQLIMASNGSLISSGNILCKYKALKYSSTCVLTGIMSPADHKYSETCDSVYWLHI